MSFQLITSTVSCQKWESCSSTFVWNQVPISGIKSVSIIIIMICVAWEWEAWQGQQQCARGAFTRSFRFHTPINIKVIVNFIIYDDQFHRFPLTTVRCHAGRGAVVRALTWGPSILAGLQDNSGGALSPRTTACWARTPLGPAGPLTVHCRRTGWEKTINTLMSVFILPSLACISKAPLFLSSSKLYYNDRYCAITLVFIKAIC